MPRAPLPPIVRLALTAATSALLAGAAQAEVASPPAAKAIKPAVAETYADRTSTSYAPKTSVDHRFPLERLTGSAGFLCDRAPGHNEQGGMSAYGYDPHGRFVGARLSLAF